MDQLGVQCASSDESDTGTKPSKYHRVKPIWRSLELENFLLGLDEIRRVQKETDSNRRSRGSETRIRLQSVYVNTDSPAPNGLPKNCYDTTWLQSLRPFVYDRKHVQEKAYDLSFPPEYGL